MANKIYTAFESDITFSTNVGPNNALFSPASLVAGSGHISIPRDLGSASHATSFRWRAKTMCSTVPTLTGTVDIYWCNNDGTTFIDGAIGSGDFDFAQVYKARNMQYLGSIVVDNAATGVPFITSGRAELTSRYGSVVWINQTQATLDGNASNHQFVLTPTPDEIQ